MVDHGSAVPQYVSHSYIKWRPLLASKGSNMIQETCTKHTVKNDRGAAKKDNLIISKVHDLCWGIWIHENSIPRQEHRRALARANRRRARRGAPIAVAGWSSEVRSTSRFQTAQCMLDVSWCFLCCLLTLNFYAFVLGCDAKMVEQCKKMVCSLTGNGQCWFFGTWMTFGWGYIQYGRTVFVFVSIWCCRLNLLYKHSKKFLQSPRILFTHAVCVCVCR